MKGKWYYVAKAEYLIRTSRFRNRRKLILVTLTVLGIVWALYLVPYISSLIIDAIASEIPDIYLLLAAIFPGLMRSIMMFLWIILIITPMSNALQEIKIGQWEIMLSSNVSTRSIMIGTFLGRMPLNLLIVLYAAPVLLAPFAFVFKVSPLGQLLMYLALFLFAMGTLWISSLLTTAIQARLGESPRGRDLARALAWLLPILTIIPLYGTMYFAETFSKILGTNLFLFFPFTWGADLITWIVIMFNGISLSPIIIAMFQSILVFDWIIDLALLVAFTLLTVEAAFLAAGRLFKIGVGTRAEKITTVGKDGVFTRGIRRASPGPFGVLLVSSIKDFTRKVQNISQMVYGILLAVILPVVTTSAGIVDTLSDPQGMLFYVLFTTGLVMALVSGMTFGGIGFLDSQDQLWIIRSAPYGASKFIKAKITTFFLLSIIFAVVPVGIITVLTRMALIEFLIVLATTYLCICGAALVGTGVAANNPAYDDTQSPTFQRNRMITILLTMGTIMIAFFGSMFLFRDPSVTIKNPLVATCVLAVPLLLVGLIAVYVGERRLDRPL